MLFGLISGSALLERMRSKQVGASIPSTAPVRVSPPDHRSIPSQKLPSKPCHNYFGEKELTAFTQNLLDSPPKTSKMSLKTFSKLPLCFQQFFYHAEMTVLPKEKLVNFAITYKDKLINGVFASHAQFEQTAGRVKIFLTSSLSDFPADKTEQVIKKFLEQAPCFVLLKNPDVKTFSVISENNGKASTNSLEKSTLEGDMHLILNSSDSLKLFDYFRSIRKTLTDRK